MRRVQLRFEATGASPQALIAAAEKIAYDALVPGGVVADSVHLEVGLIESDQVITSADERRVARWRATVSCTADIDG